MRNNGDRPLGIDAAREKALSMLEHRAYTRAELVSRLQRVTDEDTACAVAGQLEAVGLIDDEAYALQFAHDLIVSRMPGPIKLRMEMACRGIDDETAEYAIGMAEAELGGPEERLRRLIDMKYRRMLSDERGRKRASAALFRLGYKYDMIKSAVNEALDDCGVEDEFTDGTV